MSERIYLNDGWLFSEKYEDESGYKEIRIPHTCKETPFHYFDESIYQMVSGYKRIIRPLADWQGKRIHITFEGIGHESVVYVNGKEVGAHHCGYTAFTLDITDELMPGVDNEITVKVDSRESINVPPFGNVVDYMTYGGIYRDVYLEILNPSHISDIYIHTGHSNKGWYIVSEIEATADGSIRQFIRKKGEDEFKELASNNTANKTVIIKKYIDNIEAWSPENPVLYEIKTELLNERGELLHERIIAQGFRVANFKKTGFYLNGKRYKIRGLNRHQSYPYVGYAMPKSMQEMDAKVLKYELGLNAVRTSHYPQSHYFLDKCDELGLLVFTEIPGWQHIGDDEWKEQAIINVRDMVKQYRNHTSIILWGVRINESPDDDDFYKRTNEMAKKYDQIRATGGVRCIKNSKLFEDVYTYNDFIHNGKNKGCMPKNKITSNEEKAYLISEYNGHMFPTKNFDCEDHRTDHALRHANVLKAVEAQKDIAGSFGWCMSDYNTHKDFGSGDRICYHGVLDMFRNKKMAAYVYSAKADFENILEISTSMDIGEHPECIRGNAYIFTNADSVRMYKNDIFIKEYENKREPILIDDFIGDRLKEEGFSPAVEKEIKYALNTAAIHGLSHLPPHLYALAAKLVVINKFKPEQAVTLFNKYVGDWGTASTVYRFEAVKNGKVVKTLVKEPAKEIHIETEVSCSDLVEDRSYDVAAVRIRAVDQNGNQANFYNDPVVLEATGDIEIIGPRVIPLNGGMGGTYVRTLKNNGALTGKGVLKVADEVIEFNIKY